MTIRPMTDEMISTYLIDKYGCDPNKEAEEAYDAHGGKGQPYDCRCRWCINNIAKLSSITNLSPFHVRLCLNNDANPRNVEEVEDTKNRHREINVALKMQCSCSWCEGLSVNKIPQKPGPKKKDKLYKLTLTLDPSKEKTVDDLRAYFTKFVKRENVVVKGACLEHMTTNVHLHIMFEYTHEKNWFRKAWLGSYCKKYGFIKLEKVGVDNGVLEYIHKVEEHKEILV